MTGAHLRCARVRDVAGQLCALRGWDTSGSPPECPRCRRISQVLFVVKTGDSSLCSTCWLEATGQTPTTTAWREHAIVTAKQSNTREPIKRAGTKREGTKWVLRSS